MPSDDTLTKDFQNNYYFRPEEGSTQPVNDVESVSKSFDNPTPEYYDYVYKGVKLDPYRIIDVYQITNAAQAHAVKKMLRAGKSVKTLKEDIKETIKTLTRWLEMIEEDEQ